MKKILALCMALFCVLPLAATLTSCETQQEGDPSATTSPQQIPPNTDSSSQAAAAIQAEFSTFDLTDTYDRASATVTCNGSTATIEGEGAKQSGSVLEIVAEGTYLLSGSFNGQVLVNAPETDKVQLVLSGFSVTYKDSSPILCQSADKVVITLADGTKNTVIDNGSGYVDTDDTEEDPNTRTAGAIHAKCALTINGSGSLSVKANYHNGIHTKKTLKLVGGTVTVEAADDGFKGKNAVAIRDGDFTVVAGEDGIQCSEEENTAHGYIWIQGGKVNITAQGDGIDASLYLIQKGGEVTVNSIGTDRKEGTSSSTGGMGGMMPPGMGGMGGSSSDGYETNSDGYYKISSKGVKAGVAVHLSGGKLTVNSTGHGIKSAGSVTVSGETVLRIKAYCQEYRTNSKGISADTDLLISGGDTVIEYSYEGVESSGGTIYVTGGSVRVEYAADDGFNASAGGSMMGMGGMPPPGRSGEAEEAPSEEETVGGIVISGGYIYVNAFGDGLDSNGNITVSGGTVIVAGPTNGGNGALDCGDNRNYVSVTGGILVAYGSSGMVEIPDGSVTTQGTLAYTAGLSAGGLLTVTDEDGVPVIAVEITEGNVGQHVVLSCPDLQQGKTYTLYTGGSVTGEFTDGLCTSPKALSGGQKLTVLTLSSTVAGSGGMGGGGGGMGGGGRPPRH